MRYWFDFEFLEDGKTIDPMSLGMVSEDGRELYVQFIKEPGFDKRLTPWLRENVLPHMTADNWYTKPEIVQKVLRFCDSQLYGKPEFWAYYADYDWVALCQLFGRMIDLPRDWPMYCRDLKQVADMLDVGKLPPHGEQEHHALADARWNKHAWELLRLWATQKWESQELAMLMDHYFTPHYE